MTNPRRRSNSSSFAGGVKDFKTKFEAIEAEPVFEEDLHGPGLDDESIDDDTAGEKESTSGTSVDDDDVKKS